MAVIVFMRCLFLVQILSQLLFQLQPKSSLIDWIWWLSFQHTPVIYIWNKSCSKSSNNSYCCKTFLYMYHSLYNLKSSTLIPWSVFLWNSNTTIQKISWIKYYNWFAIYYTLPSGTAIRYLPLTPGNTIPPLRRANRQSSLSYILQPKFVVVMSI